jgi:hypothetical protein
MQIASKGGQRVTKKAMILALSWLLICAVSTPPVLGSTKEKEARFAEKVKAGILKLGTGPEARIEVRLRDKRKLKGYITEVGNDHFAVTDPKNGATEMISYSQVKQVKGNNLSTGAKIAIGVAIIAGILALIIVFGRMD